MRRCGGDTKTTARMVPRPSYVSTSTSVGLIRHHPVSDFHRNRRDAKALLQPQVIQAPTELLLASFMEPALTTQLCHAKPRGAGVQHEGRIGLFLPQAPRQLAA